MHRGLVLIALAASGCRSLLGLDTPQLSGDAGADAAPQADVLVDVAPDVAIDTPPGTFSRTFRFGLTGYTGTQDTYIDSGSPNANNDGAADLRWRATDRWTLLMFDQIFGTAASQVPMGSTILDAKLTVYVSNPADGVLYDVAIPWADTVTYNTFGATAGVDAGDLGAQGPAMTAVTNGSHTLDVTASVGRWSAGTAPNYGWMIVPMGAGGDGHIRSMEDLTVANRPTLVITYQ